VAFSIAFSSLTVAGAASDFNRLPVLRFPAGIYRKKRYLNTVFIESGAKLAALMC